MKTIRIFALLLFLVLVASLLVSCGDTSDREGLWAYATYTEDKSFGDGATTVYTEVAVGDKSVTFTLHTDKSTLGEALTEYNLIVGDNGAYGLYVKVVNGITADYDIDQSYWAFYQNGEMMMSGVDTTNIEDGEHYELVYTK